MAKLGEQRLGSTQFSTPVAFEAEADDVRERAEDVMKSPFPTHEGTVWDKLLSTILLNAEIQNEVVQNIIDERFVDTATQKQLDMIGELFQLDRKPNERDDHYRARLKAQIPIDTTRTTIDDLLEISASLLNTDPQRITFVESFDTEPARFDVYIEDIVFDDSTITVSEYETLLQEIKAAGVKAMATVGKQFTHRSVADYENGVNDPDRGYGGYDHSTIQWDEDAYGEGGFGTGYYGGGTLGHVTDSSTLLDTGGAYADEITQQFT